MSKKKKSGQAARIQQQQQVAAKRRIVTEATSQRRAMAQKQDEPSQATVQTQGTTRYYLDVSAVRIQEWLARTPDLKFRRGASVLVAKATARDGEFKPPSSTRWNEEAGEVSGVVSLVLDDGIGPGDAEDTLAAAAVEVARRMRELMPHCHIQAVAGSAESYADAYPHMERKRWHGDLLVDSPPAPAELILAKPCDQCRAAAATHDQIVIVASDEREKPKALCTDCNNRFDAAGGTTDDKLSRSPVPERRMKDALEQAGMAVAGFSDNFAKMAAAGQRREDNAPTQLALIFADGNRVGEFLSEAAKTASSGRAGRKIDKREIAKVIDDATVTALADAVLERFRDQLRPPVLANLAGGDDLLVSVPAADAWMFTRTLVAAFGRRVKEATREWPDKLQEKVPTLSVGIVFHHVKNPFSDVVRLAEAQLRAAKQEGRGLEPAIAFLDLTADGADPPPERKPVTLAYLDQHARQLALIEKVPPSRIATLLALYRQGATDDLIRRLTDLDNRPLWEIIAGPGASQGEVRAQLKDKEKHAELRRLLDLARHWTTAPKTEVAA